MKEVPTILGVFSLVRGWTSYFCHTNNPDITVRVVLPGYDYPATQIRGWIPPPAQMFFMQKEPV